jgi:hypothetical protein
MPALTSEVISEVAKAAIKAATDRRTAQEARNFIPAKKFGTQPDNFVFKTGSLGLGFYRDGGSHDVCLNDALFPRVVGTAPMQLQIDLLLVPTAAQVKTDKAERNKAIIGMTTEDQPTTQATKTSRSKSKKKEVAGGSQLDVGMEMAFNPNHGGWPADASIALADSSVKQARYWAIDTFNPNCGTRAAEYLKWTSADVALLQETKTEKEECPEYEDSARCTGWKLAVQPCLLGEKGGGLCWDGGRVQEAHRYAKTLPRGDRGVARTRR